MADQVIPINVEGVPDEITLTPGIQAKVRQLLDQIQFLEGKVSGMVEHACLPYPGQWQLDETGTKLVRMKHANSA